MKLEIGKEYKNGYNHTVKITEKHGNYFIDDDVIPDRYFEDGRYAGPSTLSKQNDKFNLMEIEMTQKHTPGPWVDCPEFDQDNNLLGVKIGYGTDDDFIVIAEVTADHDDLPEVYATAALIATAPDLLEALQSANVKLGNIDPVLYQACKSDVLAVIKDIQAALARATRTEGV